MSASTITPMFEKTTLKQKYLFLRSFRGQIFEIEGLIGAGKTALLLSIVHHMSKLGMTQHQIQFEKLDQRAFSKFLAIQKTVTDAEPYNRCAFPFQLAMLSNRSEDNRKTHAVSITGATCWQDRGLKGDYTFANMLYQQKHISDEEWAAYQQQIPQKGTCTPSALIVLDCSPALALERQHVRLRSGEDAYTSEYMVALRNTYAQTLMHVTQPILVIDWSSNLLPDMELHKSSQPIAHEYKGGQLLLPRSIVLEVLRLLYYTVSPPPLPSRGEPVAPHKSLLRHKIFYGGAGRAEFAKAATRSASQGIIF